MSYTYLTASGNIFTGQGSLHNVVLTGGSDTATATIKDAGDNVVAVISAGAGVTVPVPLGVTIGGAKVTLTGTSPKFTATWC